MLFAEDWEQLYYDESAIEAGKTGVAQYGWGPRCERIVKKEFYVMRGEHHNWPLLVSKGECLIAWEPSTCLETM